MNRRLKDDDGAALIVAMALVIFVGLVLAALLKLGETNLRATVQLRDQTASNYAANAAANAAIRQYQNGSFLCSSTSTPGSTTLGSSSSAFYVPPVSGQQTYNAAATCTPDTVNGTQQVGSGNVTIDTNNTLGYAVLTVGTNSGQTYGTVCVSGGSVVSNATISVGKLQVGLGTSQTSCTMQTQSSIVVTSAGTNGCNGSVNDNNTNDFTPTPCTHAAAVPMNTVGGVTGWSVLAGPPPTSGYNTTNRVNPAPLCATGNGHTYAAFAPGKYTSATLLNSPPGCTNADFEWFTPGVYYFDYGPTQWNWPTYVLGGTPQTTAGAKIASLDNFDPMVNTTANKNLLVSGMASLSTSWPGACWDPALQNDNGIEFVMGGSSVFSPNSSGTNELCASYAANGIPVAIYGVSRDIPAASSGTLSLTGGGSITAQSLCASPPCTSTSADASSGGASSMIQEDSNGHNTMIVHGYIYAPSAPISIRIKNAAPPLLGWGMVLRSLSVTTVGSSPTAPYIAYRPTLHSASVTKYKIHYIRVFTCAASSTPCSTAGTPNILVKIQDTLDSNGNVVATTVLSWSQRR